MVDWIIYYGDGTTFSSDDGAPGDAPRQNVQVVAINDIRVGRALLWDRDYYCWHAEANTWMPHDRQGLEHFLDTSKMPIRLCGFWIPDEEFQRIYQLAAEDDDRLPPKTASLPQEAHMWPVPKIED